MNYVTYDASKQEFVNSAPEPQATIGEHMGRTKELVMALNEMIHHLYECMYGEKPTVTTTATTANPTAPCLYKDLKCLEDITADSYEEIKEILAKLGGLES
jgi:hypothetical protein